MTRYTRALGLESGHRAPAPLSGEGIINWGISKMPAAVGGHLADWAWNWAIKKFPEQTGVRGTDVVGSAGVIVGAFLMQHLATRFKPDSTHFVDHVTDGMVGRIGPEFTGALRRLWGGKSANGPANGGVCCDGDGEAVRDIAQVLRDSPETTQEFADGMIAVMRRDGIELDAAGEAAVVRSMREVSTKLAR